MAIQDLYTEVIDVLATTHTRDINAGQVPALAIKYSNLPARHEEGVFAFSDPSEVGGAPTMVQGHRFFLDDPGPIVTSDVIVDETGRMLRNANVGTFRAIGDMPRYIQVTCKETQGASDTLGSSILLTPDDDPLRDTDGELLLEP